MRYKKLFTVLTSTQLSLLSLLMALSLVFINPSQAKIWHQPEIVKPLSNPYLPYVIGDDNAIMAIDDVGNSAVLWHEAVLTLIPLRIRKIRYGLERGAVVVCGRVNTC